MPTVAKRQTLSANSVEVLNAIKNSASYSYKHYVPYATDGDSIRKIGAVIMDSPSLKNEFISNLMNRIAMVLITSKYYENPWSMFKKGTIELGETIEDIFIDLIHVENYNPSDAENTLFKRTIPDVLTAFYVKNYEKHYDVTVQDKDLRKAFLSINGVTDFITKLVEKMSASVNYDEFLVMKYMLAQKIKSGQITPVVVDAVSESTARAIATDIKTVSNEFQYMSPRFNFAGVRNFSPKSDQYLILSANFDSVVDMNVLATAFNMDKAEFMGHKVQVDGFGHLDLERLDEIFAGDNTYDRPTEDVLSALDAIPAVLVDKDFFMIFDNLNELQEAQNGKGLYWNYFLHAWRTFACSSFANSAVFIPAVPAVTSVTASPSSATVGAGGSVQIVPTVVTQNFAPMSCDFEVTANADVIETVDSRGVVRVKSTATTGSTATVRVKSTYDTSKYVDVVITVA